MTSTLPTRHATFLARLIETVSQDGRFDAILGGGSMVHGGFDDYSDIDLILVVKHSAHAAVMDERHVIAATFGELVSAFIGLHVGEPRLLICLYGPELLHVDLKFVRLGELTTMVERPVILWAREHARVVEALDRAVVAWPNRSPEWFEERAWTWLHYGGVKLQRGELFEALATLCFFSELVLGPMLQRRHGLKQRGLRRLEQAGIADALRPVLAGHDRESVSRALRNAMGLYLELREDVPPAVRTARMPELVAPYLD